MSRFVVAALALLVPATPFAQASVVVLWDTTVVAPGASENNRSFDEATLLFSAIEADQIVAMGGDDAFGEGLASAFHTHAIHPVTDIFLDLHLDGAWTEVLATSSSTETETPISSLTASAPISFSLGNVDGLRWRSNPHGGWNFHNFNDGSSGLGTQTFFEFERPLIGDTFPLDGVINITDLNNVRNHFGNGEITGPPTDGDTYPFDGKVDLGDLNRVRNFFGTGVESTAVPEPSAWLVLVSSLFVLFAYRRSFDHRQ